MKHGFTNLTAVLFESRVTFSTRPSCGATQWWANFFSAVRFEKCYTKIYNVKNLVLEFKNNTKHVVKKQYYQVCVFVCVTEKEKESLYCVNQPLRISILFYSFLFSFSLTLYLYILSLYTLHFVNISCSPIYEVTKCFRHLISGILIFPFILLWLYYYTMFHLFPLFCVVLVICFVQKALRE